jgi:hypothetical protein
LKRDNFQCAAELLEGREAYATPSAIRASYRRVERNLADGTSIVGVPFHYGFLTRIGVKDRAPRGDDLQAQLHKIYYFKSEIDDWLKSCDG